MTVKQTGDTLTIERTRGDNKVDPDLQARRLREQERGPRRRGRVHGEVGRQQARHHDQDRSGRAVQTWSMEGGNLTIERTGGRGPSKTTYKKTT